MRFLLWSAALGSLCLAAAALYLIVPGPDVWAVRSSAHVTELCDDDQEIAFIEPATNADGWERLVAAVTQIRRDWPSLFPDEPALHINVEHAFPALTADVPEIGLRRGDSGPTLWVRWYKISSDNDPVSWIERLRARPRPPLAVLGGGTSGRAIRLGQALQAVRAQDWTGQSPVYLMTTATAEHDPRVAGRLIDVYPGRSFRYSFTNRIMVGDVLSFLDQNPQVWVHKHSEPAVLAGAAIAGDAWGMLGVLWRPVTMHTVHWEDDSYSRDLADAFRDAFRSKGPIYDEGSIPYSGGDAYHPTPPEQAAVGALLANRSPFPPHSLLVLPGNAPRMRRVLGNLRSRAPLDVRNLLVVNGDSLGFNTVYRDRDYAWNIQDLPFSLLFFSHRNPIETSTGFAWHGSSAHGHSETGTQDLLLHRDIVESILHAAFQGTTLLHDADTFRDRLRETRWYQPLEPDRFGNRVYNSLVHSWAKAARPFFDNAGDRQTQTGEHVVWLRPNFSGDRLDLLSTLSVWEIRPEPGHTTWQLVASRDVPYNQLRLEGE